MAKFSNTLLDLGCTEPVEMKENRDIFMYHKCCEQYVYEGQVLAKSCEEIYEEVEITCGHSAWLAGRGEKT